MSFTNQTTSSLSDFISRLDTFLDTTVSPTWTTHDTNFAGGEWAARRTGTGFDIAIATQWDTATPLSLAIYQWKNAAYNSGNDPWAQTDDSGNGATSTSEATIDDNRNVILTNTPVQFWCFEDNDYFHVVVETALGTYVHFGAGQLRKFGDWTGGEYVYGHRQQGAISANVSVLTGSTMLLDGLSQDGGAPTPSNMEEFAATVACENLPGQATNGMYAVHMGNQASGNLGNDRQAVPVAREHFIWGMRGGPYARLLSRFDGSDLSGHLPMYPIVSAYWRRGTNDVYGPMGYMRDVRGVSMRNYVGGDQVTVGSDTWFLFPSRTKWISGAHTGLSDFQGIAYRQVTG